MMILSHFGHTLTRHLLVPLLAALRFASLSIGCARHATHDEMQHGSDCKLLAVQNGEPSWASC